MLAMLVAAPIAAQVTAYAQANFSNYNVIERGPNHRVLQKVSAITNGTSIAFHTNTLIHVAQGMNRLVSGEWVPSAPALLLTNGGILGVGGRAAVFFADNANSPTALRVTMPNGQLLTSHVLGVAYYDPSLQTNLFIGTLKDSTAQVVGSNTVLYPDAFDGIACSIRYKYSPAGVEQDLLWETRMAPPEN